MKRLAHRHAHAHAAHVTDATRTGVREVHPGHHLITFRNQVDAIASPTDLTVSLDRHDDVASVRSSPPSCARVQWKLAAQISINNLELNLYHAACDRVSDGDKPIIFPETRSSRSRFTLFSDDRQTRVTRVYRMDVAKS